jgi:ribonuclease VapC
VVVDSSALLAVLLDEPEQHAVTTAIEAAGSKSMSVATFVEASIVIESRYGGQGLYELDTLLERSGIELVPVDVEQAKVARRAFSRFGKGRHPARLNYGDCFAYALARVLGEPLLFKGNDFAETDVAAVETIS